jgi:hypothetical protein
MEPDTALTVAAALSTDPLVERLYARWQHAEADLRALRDQRNAALRRESAALAMVILLLSPVEGGRQ